MTKDEALKLALDALQDYVDEYGYDRLECFEHFTAIKEALSEPEPEQEQEQEPVAWEQFYPDIGKPQLEQLPQLSQEVVLQYPKEAVDWQKQQKEYAQQLKVEGPCHVVCQCDKCKAQEQEPVKDWIASHNEICALLRQAHDALALTSYPPQRAWVGLTNKEFDEIYDSYGTVERAMKAVEAKLKEKNT